MHGGSTPYLVTAILLSKDFVSDTSCLLSPGVLRLIMPLSPIWFHADMFIALCTSTSCLSASALLSMGFELFTIRSAQNQPEVKLVIESVCTLTMGYVFVKKIMDQQQVELRQTNHASS